MALFPQFTRLPAEIQWVIWELASSEPNTHFLTMNSGHHSVGQLRPIYWKPEMDDAVVCRQIQWLWDGDACPKLETIYIDISMRSKRYRWFHCTLQNHVHLAARRRTRTGKGVVDIQVRNLPHCFLVSSKHLMNLSPLGRKVMF
ncbi:Putative protein of unknown function [Podospora comata]|uniref:2EXR domain-containing protein n=1 Tax=Podospora comata TaxID=48703 RepID=A0ABY6SDS2_PODCO|nr:Putative protein of unknown function [Podospora comata]